MEKLVISSDFEALQKRKMELEGKLQSLTEKERNLEENVKKLEIKLEINKTEVNIKTRREALDQLESKISNLRAELRKPDKISEEEKPESAECVEEENKTGVTVTTVPVEEEVIIESQTEIKTEKKKRSFF